MIKNYLLITFRSLMKNKLFISINIIGMAIALACCIVGYFNYDFNATFDEHHQNAATIYRVNSIREFQNERTKYGIVPVALGEMIKENVKDVDAVMRYSPGGGNFRIKEELLENELMYIDIELFNVFTFEFVEGAPGDPHDKSAMYINQTLSKKYFGNEPALGKTVTQLLDSGKTKDFVVAGVFKDQPANSSLFASAYTCYDNYIDDNAEVNARGWYYRNALFVQVKNPDRIASITDQVRPYTEITTLYAKTLYCVNSNSSRCKAWPCATAITKHPAHGRKKDRPKRLSSAYQ
ncbi:MAG: ABC transporter permease [Bacteroidia bacterium]|nr:ABC transporter permease [Bacteroidia bacterium]